MLGALETPGLSAAKSCRAGKPAKQRLGLKTKPQGESQAPKQINSTQRRVATKFISRSE
jgi:hypothetical protein